MVQSVTYQSETKTVHFQGKSIVLESLTPVLSPKEKEKRKKEIERCLYEVFASTEGPAIPWLDHRQHCPSGLSMV